MRTLISPTAGLIIRCRRVSKFRGGIPWRRGRAGESDQWGSLCRVAFSRGIGGWIGHVEVGEIHRVDGLEWRADATGDRVGRWHQLAHLEADDARSPARGDL